MKQQVDLNGFANNGVAFARDLLSLSEVSSLDKLLRQALPTTVDSQGYSREYTKAYLAGIDLALKNESLKNWAKESALSRLAADLLSTKVTFIRDQLFEKSASLLGTPFHQDAYSLPYYCREVVTIWIPLTEVRFSPLVFKLKTHLERSPYPRPNTYNWEDTEELSTYGLTPGDVSIHHGWTVHGSRAPSKLSQKKESTFRRAWAVMYASAKEYAEKTPHPHDKWMEAQDEEYLQIVRRTRKEILDRKY